MTRYSRLARKPMFGPQLESDPLFNVDMIPQGLNSHSLLRLNVRKRKSVEIAARGSFTRCEKKL